MNLAVKLYSTGINPLNIPGVWPSQVLEIGESTVLPDNTWLLMTTQEYADYVSIYKSTYDAWYLTYISGQPINMPPTETVTIKSLPELLPFAQPTYRTKRNATASMISINAGDNQDMKFQLTAERYISGGCLIVENAEFGDYITAEVEDIDGLIPSIYRTTLCEAYPIVSTYVEKEYVKISTPGSIQAGSISLHDIDTSPLNAKLTAGLYLCIHYYAVNTGLTRRVAVNYHLTKKL